MMRYILAILVTLGMIQSFSCSENTNNFCESDCYSDVSEEVGVALSWITVHEALSSGGVVLRVQATTRALDAVPNLTELTASEPVDAVIPGGGVVLDAAWAIAPQDTSLVDPWRIELAWDPRALTADEMASLVVITESVEGGWRRANVQEFSVTEGRAVVYALELGRLGLAAANVGADVTSFHAALPTPARVAPADLSGTLGEVVVDTLGDNE